MATISGNSHAMLCKVAIVGSGPTAREHLRAFADLPGVSIAGVTSRTRAKAQTLANEFNVPVTAVNVEELYERTRADIVQVSVYETAIAEIMDRVLQYPWTVLMEKPIGLNAQEAEAILAKATRANRNVFAGLNRRALSSTVAALENLANEPSPRFIHVQDQQSLEVARAIGHQPEVVANWMYANSVHLVDYFLTFGRGPIESVTPIQPWDPDHPGVVLAHLRFTSGDTGIYQGVWNGPAPWACAVSNARRRWELRPLEKASYQTAESRQIVALDPDAWDSSFKPGFRRQAERIFAAWRGEKTAQPTLADGVEAMRLVRRVYGL